MSHFFFSDPKPIGGDSVVLAHFWGKDGGGPWPQYFPSQYFPRKELSSAKEGLVKRNFRSLEGGGGVSDMSDLDFRSDVE